MNLLNKYVGCTCLWLVFSMCINATGIEQPAWSRLKTTVHFIAQHPGTTAKTCSRICAKGLGVGLAAGVLGYYAIRGLKNLADKINCSVLTQSLIFIKPVKKAVVIAGLVLLAYQCWHSMIGEIHASAQQVDFAVKKSIA